MNITERLLNSEEYVGDEAVPGVAHDAAGIIGDLVVALKNLTSMVDAGTSADYRAAQENRVMRNARAAIRKVGAA